MFIISILETKKAFRKSTIFKKKIPKNSKTELLSKMLLMPTP